jgi:hypothetical protein
MLKTLGSALSLPLSLAEADRTLLAVQLGKLLDYRSDSVSKLSNYLAGVAGCRSGHFHVTDVARAAPEKVSYKKLRHLLDESPWPHWLIRRALCSSAPLAEVRAFVVELEETKHGSSCSDILSISAVGEDFTQPLAWTRVPSALEDGDRPGDVPAAADVDQREAEALSRVLGSVADEYARLEPLASVPVPPLIAPDGFLGMNPLLRTAALSHVAEFVFEVDGDFDDIDAVRLPYDPRVAHLSVADLFSGWPGSDPPPPRELRTHKLRRLREHAAVLPGHGLTRYALVHPWVAMTKDELAGQRLRERTAELASLAAGVGTVATAKALGISDFVHESDLGFERHALLLSFQVAHLAGRLPDDLGALRAPPCDE